MQNKAVLDYMYTILCHKDEDTAKHSSRVAAIAHTIGKKMRLYDDDMELLDEASRLHDIGKNPRGYKYPEQAGETYRRRVFRNQETHLVRIFHRKPAGLCGGKCRSVASRKIRRQRISEWDFRNQYPAICKDYCSRGFAGRYGI